MIIPTDHDTLLRNLGAYAYGTAVGELADRLQSLQGVATDRIFTGIEILYTFREQLGESGLELLGQLTGFTINNQWKHPGEEDRIERIYQGVLRDVEGAVYTDLIDPEPKTVYRADGLDWRKQVQPNLDQLKAAKWAAVKNLRQEKETSVCSTPYGVVQIDESSKVKITGLVNMALIAQSNAQPFSETWTMADNSVVTLDATGAITLGVTVGQYVSAVYERARVLREEIDAVVIDGANPDTEAALQDAIAQLDAIDVTTSWPA